MSIVEGLKRGFKKAEDIMTARQDYRHSVLNKDFYRDVKQKTEGTSEFLGAYAAPGS